MSAGEAHEYVARAVLPAMGIAGRRFTVAPPSESGTRSSLHLIRADGMPPLLLRAFGHRAQAARNAEALRHLDAIQLPAPRLVFYDLWPVHITVETWIEGTPHADLTDPAAARAAALTVAALLARYHAVTRAVWGRPTATIRPHVFSFITSTLVIVRRMVKELGTRGWLVEREAAQAIERFSAWKETIGALTTFNLVHNDANRHNFVVSHSGEVTPVDLHRLAYGAFPEEVVNALYHFCRKDGELAMQFVEAYLAGVDDQARAVFDRTRGFFEPLNYLKKMHRRGQTGVASDDAKMKRWREVVVSMQGPPG
jgi:phosphotransferase family enzyme